MNSYSPSAARRPGGHHWRGADPDLDLISRRLEREADACMTPIEADTYVGPPAAPAVGQLAQILFFQVSTEVIVPLFPPVL
jgi:hypothetical protein